MTTLLDSNVLIALVFDDHVHHDAANVWLASHDGPVASCPITQGAFVRAGLRADWSVSEVKQLLAEVFADLRHEFWPDDVSYLDIPMTGVIGHRQVTDAYLAQLARHRGGRLATFDGGLACVHPDVVERVPVPNGKT